DSGAVDPHLQYAAVRGDDFAADPAVIKVDLLADACVVENFRQRTADPRNAVGVGGPPPAGPGEIQQVHPPPQGAFLRRPRPPRRSRMLCSSGGTAAVSVGSSACRTPRTVPVAT